MVLKSSERFHAEKKTAATTLLVFAALLDTCAAIGSVQSAAAKGKLLCKGKPYFNAKIKLFDTDLSE